MEIPMHGNTKVKELYNDVDSFYTHVVVLDLKVFYLTIIYSLIKVLYQF